MLTKSELVDFLIKNFEDKNGNLDLSGLDFGDFEGDVITSHWTVKGSLLQSNQNVGVSLYQGYQKAGFDIYQSDQKAKYYLFQNSCEVGGRIIQNSHNAAIAVYEGGHQEGSKQTTWLDDFLCQSLDTSGNYVGKKKNKK